MTIFGWRSSLLYTIVAPLLCTNYTINFFVREYPEEIIAKQQTPDYKTIHKQIIKNTFYQPVTSGVYAIYNGYLTHSDEQGLISFPRQTQLEQFTFIITPNIQPTFTKDTNTIDYWTITDPGQTAAYVIKKHKDPETKLRYWKVLKAGLPKDNHVPLHAIIVIAKPKNIYVPIGVTPTTKLPNLLLPPIYAKHGLDRIKNALFLLNIKQFFASVETMSSEDKDKNLRSTIIV